MDEMRHRQVFAAWREQVLASGKINEGWAVYRSGGLFREASPALPVTPALRNAVIPQTAIAAGHAFGVVWEGRMIAWAFCEAPVHWPPGVMWVAVQTLEAYRRKGYALMALTALRQAVEPHHTLVYLHTAGNQASGALAQAAGFVRDEIWQTI